MELMDQIARHLNLPQLRLNAKQACALRVNNNLQIELHLSKCQRCLHLIADLGQLSGIDMGAIYCELLRLNQDTQKLHGMCYALHPESGAVMLKRTFDYRTLTFDVIWAAILQAVDCVDASRTKVHELVRLSTSSFQKNSY
jgi:hypothetical protein